MNLDDILSPPSLMLGPQGVEGTLAQQGRPKPKPQRPLQTPITAKKAPVDLSDNPFADTSGNPFAGDASTPAAPDTSAKYHTLYQQGRLGKLEAGLNADDQEALPTHTGDVLETLETPLAGVPGGAAAMSLARKAVNPSQSLASIQKDVNHGTSDTKASWLGRGIGGIATQGALPGMTAAGAGATIGGLDQLLNNDPNSGIGNRAWRGAGGAAAGYGIGKVLDAALTGGRALVSKGGEAAKDAATGARSEVTDPLYAAVRSAPPQPLTPEMSAALQHPDIAPIVERLQTLEQYKGKGPNDPELLMAARKSLSDWGHTLDKQGLVVDPSKPNNIAALKEHVGLLKALFDKAADTQIPGFSKAVKTFAEESVPVSAQEQGYDAMRRKLSGNLTAWKNIGKKTPGALGDFLDRTPEALRSDAGAGAATGILGATRDAFAGGARVAPFLKAPALLNTADRAAGGIPTAYGDIPNLSLATRRALLGLLQGDVSGR